MKAKPGRLPSQDLFLQTRPGHPLILPHAQCVIGCGTLPSISGKLGSSGPAWWPGQAPGGGDLGVAGMISVMAVFAVSRPGMVTMDHYGHWNLTRQEGTECAARSSASLAS